MTPEEEAEETSPAEFPLQDLLGFEIEHGDQEAWVRLDLGHRHTNPNGVAHGSVLFALMDTAMGAATMAVVDPGQLCTTIEIHTRFMRPAIDGLVTAHAAVINAGKKIVHLQAEARDREQRLLASATGSFMVLEPRS